jgi:hypothetical protein
MFSLNELNQDNGSIALNIRDQHWIMYAIAGLRYNLLFTEKFLE